MNMSPVLYVFPSNICEHVYTVTSSLGSCFILDFHCFIAVLPGFLTDLTVGGGGMR